MKNASRSAHYSALVLAGDRHANDPVAALGNAGCKALTDIHGVPMLHRVLAALRGSQAVSSVTLVGPGQRYLERDALIQEMLGHGEVSTLEPADSPCASVLLGLRFIPTRPVFVTTADHALLTSDMVDYFLEHSRLSGCDVTVALTPLQTVQGAFPGHRRTAIKLHGGPFCGSNMFAFMTKDSEKLADFWRTVEQERKDPRKVVAGALGLIATLAYLAGLLSVDGAMRRISRKVGLRIGAIIMPFAEAAVDVDSVSDYTFVEEVLRQRALTICR